jgi:quinol monooxygenase YgiN
MGAIVTVIVLLEFQVKSESLEETKAMLKAILPDTRSYAGCLGLDVGCDADEPTKFVFCERWESREHYDRYLAWRTETGFMDRFGGHLAGAPTIRYFSRLNV